MGTGIGYLGIAVLLTVTLLSAWYLWRERRTMRRSRAARQPHNLQATYGPGYGLLGWDVGNLEWEQGRPSFSRQKRKMTSQVCTMQKNMQSLAAAGMSAREAMERFAAAFQAQENFTKKQRGKTKNALFGVRYGSKP